MNIITVKQTQFGLLVNEKNLVPVDEMNRNYQEVQAWIKNGGVIDPEFTDKEIQEQQKNQQKEQLEKDRKIAQFSNITLANGKELCGTAKARDNLFKAFVLMKESGEESIFWLDIDNNPFSITKDEILQVCNDFKERDSRLYLEEAEAIANL